MSRYLDPKTDVVFKKIFGDHPHLLKSFLNAVLPLPSDGQIESLEYLPTEQVPVIPTFKYNVVDVKCKDQQGRIFIVEMQIQWVPNFLQRLLFGASRAYVRQLQKGEQYEFLNPVYGLGILAGTFDKTEEWYHHYKMVNVEHPEHELKGLQLVFIELPKFKPTRLNDKKLQVLWLRFLSETSETSRKIEPELLAVPEINEAAMLAEEAGFTPGELDLYDKYWDSVSIEKSLIRAHTALGREQGRTEGREEGMQLGHKKGLEEGLQQGIQQGHQIGLDEGQHQGKLEIAKKLLLTGMSLEETSRMTHLSVDKLLTLKVEV